MGEEVEASWEAQACQVGGDLELMKDSVVREAVSLSHVHRTSAKRCPS